MGCSAEDELEVTPEVFFMAKLKPECNSNDSTPYCIPEAEFNRLTEEWVGTCMQVSFTDLEGNTITGILKGLDSSAETDAYCKANL